MKKSRIHIILIVIGVIIVTIGIILMLSLSGTEVYGDMGVRGAILTQLHRQRVTYFFVIFIGIILFVTGLILKSIDNSKRKSMIQCKNCGAIHDMSNSFCNKCGTKL